MKKRKSYRVNTRSELYEQDYIKKLSKKDLDFLKKFNKEYINATFDKNDEGNYSEENLHKTHNNRKDIYNLNNRRNRCVYNKAKAKNLLDLKEDITKTVDQITNQDKNKDFYKEKEEIENFLNDMVDRSIDLKKSIS